VDEQRLRLVSTGSNDLTVFTLATRDFLPGVAGLVNSLRATGFQGRVVIGAPEPLPELDRVPGVEVVGFGGEPMWVGHLKPRLILDHAKDDFIFFDADIIVTEPSFLPRVLEMLATGPVVTIEGLVAPFDHRRLRWSTRLGTPPPRETAWAYYNAGLVAGRMSRERAFLESWDQGMRRVIGDRRSFERTGDFPFSDQDVLNGLLQCRAEPVVTIQMPDWQSSASPLNPFFHLGAFGPAAVQHCTGAKPWRLTGVPPRWKPSAYDRLWYHFAVTAPNPVRVPVTLPPAVHRWLAGSALSQVIGRMRLVQNRISGA
jgi:hypothetical protein